LTQELARSCARFSDMSPPWSYTLPDLDKPSFERQNADYHIFSCQRGRGPEPHLGLEM
jgi:hypothetical protein